MTKAVGSGIEHDHDIKKEDFFYVIENNYDEHIELAIPFYRRMHDDLIRLIPDKYGKHRFLDLGCGTGKTSALLLQHFPHAVVDGFDLFKEMLGHARNRLKPFKNRISLRQGDFRTLDFESTYDVCVSALAIHHSTSQEKKALYKKINGCLLDSGMFLMIDWTDFKSRMIKDCASRIAELYVRERISDEVLIQEWLDHWREKNIPDTVEDQIQWLLEAGFSTAECVVRYYGIALICAEKTK